MQQLPANTFKQALQRREVQIGLWCSYAFGPTVEGLALAGYDWLLLDMEHSTTDLAALGQMLVATRGTPAQPVVRVPALDVVMIKRALDAGAPTLMIPDVRSAEQARLAVSATRFPPQGVRGMATSTRAAGWGHYKDFAARANDEVGLVLQIESPQALAELPAICAVDGVDAVFIGPSDLAATLGHRGQQGHPEVRAAMLGAIATARAAGRSIGLLVGDGQAEPWLDAGATMVAVGSDTGVLMRGAVALAERFAPYRGKP